MNTSVSGLLMHIEEIEIRNFRIYNGTNRVVFPFAPGKSVHIIGGDNGRGKTTFLTSLVWCLYGKQMQEVDKFYRDRVAANGGYRRYLESCMNRQALSDGEAEFSVSITFRGVALPGVECESMAIARTYNVSHSNEFLEIAVDDAENELVDEFGRQLFIQEFLLPKEIAKFFFFDAERIVTMAETQSIEDKRRLGQAYSEVLGIKRYEDLRRNLSDLRIRLRKDSANALERQHFESFGQEIIRLTKARKRYEARRERLVSEKEDLRAESDRMQEKLLLQGNHVTLPEMKRLQEEETRLSEQMESLIGGFRDLMELAPFAIAGATLVNIQSQLDAEEKQDRSLADKSLMENRIDAVIQALRNEVDTELAEFDPDLTRLRDLLMKHLIDEQDSSSEREVAVLHDFTGEQRHRFGAVLSNLGTRYSDRLRSVAQSIRVGRQDYAAVSRKLADIRVMETDALVKEYRAEKSNIDLRIRGIDEEIQKLSQSLGSLESEISSKEKRYEELAERVRLDDELQEKDTLVKRLIGELDAFVRMIKMKRKDSLENRVLSTMNELMHKTNLIHKVIAGVDTDAMDFILIDGRGREIGRDDLSKGEQQLYASAILKALVEESGIRFPVLVDSPLQKFDDKHARNAITGFYPKISGQVILLPLLNKELTEEEYGLLASYVNSTFVIDNIGEEASRLREVVPAMLFANRAELVGAPRDD